MLEFSTDLERCQLQIHSLRDQVEAEMQHAHHLDAQIYKLTEENKLLKQGISNKSDHDLGMRCDWLENQLEIVYEYEKVQADEIASLKEVIRKLFSNIQSLYEVVQKLDFIKQRGVDRV